MSKHSFLSTKVSIKNIFLGLFISFFAIFIFINLYLLTSNLLQEEEEVVVEEKYEVIKEKEIDNQEEVQGEQTVDEEIVAEYIKEVKAYLLDVETFIFLTDLSFAAMNKDIVNSEEYAKRLNGMATDCDISKYYYDKDNIPNDEVVENIEKIESISIDLCDDLITVTNLVPQDDDPDVLKRIRDINEDAYNKTVVMQMLSKEVEKEISYDSSPY
jgi:hypothetical protein